MLQYIIYHNNYKKFRQTNSQTMKKLKSKPFGHSAKILSLSMATVEVGEYRNGPISDPSYSRNFNSTRSSSGILPLLLSIQQPNPQAFLLKKSALNPPPNIPIQFKSSTKSVPCSFTKKKCT